MTPRSRWLILGFALLGLGFASYSAWVHYKLLTDVAYRSPCDISQTFNCSTVYLSSYGSFAGIPVALYGMFWFGLVALIAWASKPVALATNQPPAAGAAYVFALSTVGLAVILYLGYTSYSVLKTACILCMGTYASVIAIFIVSGAAASLSVRELPARFGRDLGAALRRPEVIVLFLILFGGLGYAATTFPPEGTVPQETSAPSAGATGDFATAWARQPRIDLGIPADGAKVVVVKFNDYQCPGCGATHEWYKPVLEKFEKSNPGAIKLVVKDWPWNGKCNFNLAPGAPPNHLGACEGAAAVRMARDQSPAKESEMQEWLYSHQAEMTPDTVKAAASRILGITDFDRQYAQKLPEIKKDIADGTALHVRSTPTLYINGVYVNQDRALMPASYFELAIQLELNKSAGK